MCQNLCRLMFIVVFVFAILILITGFGILAAAEQGSDQAKKEQELERYVKIVKLSVEDESVAIDVLSVTKAIERIGKIELPKEKKKEAVVLLCKLLQRKAKVKMVKDSYCPSVMRPIEFLQVYAIQALARIGDTTALPYLRSLHEESKESYMQAFTKDAIEKLGGKVGAHDSYPAAIRQTGGSFPPANTHYVDWTCPH